MHIAWRSLGMQWFGLPLFRKDDMMCHRCAGFSEINQIEGAIDFRVVAKHGGDVACALNQVDGGEESMSCGGCGAVVHRESTADLGAREHAGIDEHVVREGKFAEESRLVDPGEGTTGGDVEMGDYLANFEKEEFGVAANRIGEVFFLEVYQL